MRNDFSRFTKKNPSRFKEYGIQNAQSKQKKEFALKS